MKYLIDFCTAVTGIMLWLALNSFTLAFLVFMAFARPSRVMPVVNCTLAAFNVAVQRVRAQTPKYKI